MLIGGVGGGIGGGLGGLFGGWWVLTGNIVYLGLAMAVIAAVGFAGLVTTVKFMKFEPKPT
jgi:hypothetical protein